MDKWSENIPGNQETSLHKFLCFFERPVFVFNTDHIVISEPVQCADELAPVHITKAWKPWDVVSNTRGESTLLVELFTVNRQVFGMHVENLVGKFTHDPLIIDHLED